MMGRGIMSDSKLTMEAKNAIRSYMLCFVIPSGVLLSIVSGVSGYVLSGLARIDATADATKVALTAVQETAKANANAAQAAKEAADAKDKAVSASISADETQKYILRSKVNIDQIQKRDYGELAKSLFDIKDFRDAVGTIAQREISDINLNIQQIRDIIKQNGESIKQNRDSIKWSPVRDATNFDLNCDYKLRVTSWLNEFGNRTSGDKFDLLATKVSSSNITASFLGGPYDRLVLQLRI
jgi:hypothetical protein